MDWLLSGKKEEEDNLGLLTEVSYKTLMDFCFSLEFISFS